MTGKLKKLLTVIVAMIVLANTCIMNVCAASNEMPESEFVVIACERITRCNEKVISIPTFDGDQEYVDFVIVSLTGSAKGFGKNKFVMWTENELCDADKASIVAWVRENGEALFKKITVDTTVFLCNGGENPYSQFVSFEMDENMILGTSMGAKSVWQQILYGCGYNAPAEEEETEETPAEEEETEETPAEADKCNRQRHNLSDGESKPYIIQHTCF